MSSEMVKDMKKALRVTSEDAEGEIEDLIAACLSELEMSGVYAVDENDPRIKQAVKLYCKAHYGYDEHTEKFSAAYESLRNAMALSGDYRRADEGGNRTDMDAEHGG